MLESIYIENFAIIDQLQIDFHDQMTVLTGETGAGKSIIIDAIGQLCGNRSQTSFIKSDANESFIEGVFSIKDNSSILDKLREYRIEYDDKLIVSKSFNRNNKTTIKINYRNVSTMALKSIMKELIDIHSQFETHTLFDSNNHINILDDYIGKPLVSLKQKYKEVYQKYIDIKKTYQKAVEEELSDEQLEYYQSQLSEINSLNLTEIDEEKCQLCGNCIKLCKFKSLSISDDKLNIDPMSCTGCGKCLTACKNAAITVNGNIDEKIFATIDGILTKKEPGERLILVFLDNIGYTAADNIGVNRLSYPESIHIIKVLSVNRVRPRHIKHALENGADGVFIGEFPGDLMYEEVERKIERVKNRIAESNQNPERLAFSKVYIPYFTGLAKKLTDFDKKIKMLNESE